MEIIGYTDCNKAIVTGMYKHYETHGLPIEIMMKSLYDKKVIPCPISLFSDMVFHGVNKDIALNNIQLYYKDLYGNNIPNGWVKHWLNALKDIKAGKYNKPDPVIPEHDGIKHKETRYKLKFPYLRRDSRWRIDLKYLLNYEQQQYDVYSRCWKTYTYYAYKDAINKSIYYQRVV